MENPNTSLFCYESRKKKTFSKMIKYVFHTSEIYFDKLCFHIATLQCVLADASKVCNVIVIKGEIRKVFGVVGGRCRKNAYSAVLCVSKIIITEVPRH